MTSTSVLSAEFENIDAQLAKAVNGDEGGSWAPSTEITFTGANGLRSFVFKAGQDVTPGNATFDVLGTNVIVRGTSTFDGSPTFNATATFNDEINCNEDVYFNKSILVQRAMLFGALGTFTISGAKFALDDGGHPSRSATATSYGVKYGAANGSGITSTAGAVAGTITFVGTPAAGQYVDVELLLDPNVSHTNFVVRLKGGTGHAALPSALPTVSLFELDATGVTTTLATLSVAPGTVAAYEAGFNTTLTPMTFTPNRARRYILRVFNESGTNAQGLLTLHYATANGNAVTFGRGWGL